MTASPAALSIGVEAVEKCYGGVSALAGIDLKADAGEFLTLLGPSGSGKTTLLMILAGFARPDSGRVLFGDAPVHRLPPHRRNVGMVFQSYALFPHMTVAENIAYPLKVRGVSRGERDAEVRRALSFVQLDGFGDRRPKQLSGGQAQRVALARATVFRPKILLMDEPLSALDKKLRDRMQIEIRRIHDELGVTTVYVTHDQREALTMSDRIAVLDRGHIQQIGAPGSIYSSPETAFVADFIGESSLLPVERSGDGVAYLGQRIAGARRPATPTKSLFLVLRPEKLRLLRGGEAAPDDASRFEGIVSGAAFQGETSVVYMRVHGGREIAIRSLSQGSALPAPGEPATALLLAADALVVRGDE